MKLEDIEIPETDLKIKEENRDELKETLGPIVQGDLPKKYTEKKPIITVGDVVTYTLIEQGIYPDVGIIDGKTQRGSFEKRCWKSEKETEIQQIEIQNPQSFITREAWETIEEALGTEEKVIIYVEGEEDMLSLPSIALCPLYGIVIYGVPDEGMVINEVSKEIKKKTWKIINKMIEVGEGR